jgi:hypothetical protein
MGGTGEKWIEEPDRRPLTAPAIPEPEPVQEPAPVETPAQPEKVPAGGRREVAVLG